MRRRLLVLVVSSGLLLLSPIRPASADDPPPVHTLAVSGTGVGMYPVFDAATQRYGVTTTDDTGGTVVVTATTTDPLGSVWVDGRRVVDGTATVTGLTSGDEISIFIEDSAGTAVHSLVYLPAQFPTLSVVGSGTPEGGDVLLTLSKFDGITPNFETAVDRNGVPAYVRSSLAMSLDLKRLANGHYTVSRQGASDGKTGWTLDELDNQFRPIATYETEPPLVNTDGHDSILRPNGSRILIAYEPNAVTNKTDAVIQDVDAAGNVTFTWNSADHVLASDGVGDPVDYAHINSIAIMDDGDILASFRHLSQVLKIAWSDRPGVAKGDVVWRLGGRRSDFTFVDDDADSSFLGGPCAQHTATQLPNGDILLYDDGSWPQNAMCIDPTDPTGPTTARLQSRVTEYQLDTAAGTATQVWNYQVPGRFTLFAGSAWRLPDGDTLVGWASARQAIATLVDPAGVAQWELKDATTTDELMHYFTYRATAASVPDAVAPAVDVVRPEQGATYSVGQVVTNDFGCTDRGGSSLASCQAGDARSGDALDTSVPGSHTFTMQATDQTGNVTSVTRTYHVTAPAVLLRPDGMIRKHPGGRQVGSNVYGGSATQGVRQAASSQTRSATAIVRFQNDGDAPDQITVRGTAGSHRFRVHYFAGGTDVTRQVTAGTYRTPALLPGQASRLRVRVTRTGAAEVGNHRVFRLRGTSVGDTSRWDAVRTRVRATR